MKTELLSADHPIALQHTVDVLRHGGLVAFPTDTVYGLASLPFQAEYVERLFAAKGRNSSRAIAILVGKIEDLPLVTGKISKKAQLLARKFWPGALTLVVSKNSRLPDVLSQTTSVGVRMPDHPLALSLLAATGPLAVTSANRSGLENASTAQDVMEQLDGRIHLVLDGGRVPGGVPSTVVDCTRSELMILREGPVTLEAMQRALAELG